MSNVTRSQTMLGRLQEEVIASDSRLTRRPKASRRLINCAVIELNENPNPDSEQELVKAIKTRYTAVYGFGLLGYILVHIFIGVVVHVIVEKLREWWERRQNRDKDVVAYTTETLAMLAKQANEDLESDSHTIRVATCPRDPDCVCEETDAAVECPGDPDCACDEEDNAG